MKSVAEHIKDALLLEYPWQDHDNWNEDNVRDHHNPWPHLDHVAEVAAQVAEELLFPSECHRLMGVSGKRCSCGWSGDSGTTHLSDVRLKDLTPRSR